MNLSVADVNRDGKPDVIIGELLSQGAINSTVDSGPTVLLGNGDGTFRQGFAQAQRASAAPVDVKLIDFRGTGILDLVETVIPGGTGGGPGTVEIRTGNGDGTFGPIVSVPLAGDQIGLASAIADFNSDGRPDIAIVSISAALLKSAPSQTSFVDLPAGSIDVLLNTTVPTTFTVTNAASFRPGPVAPDSIVSAFGRDLAPSTAPATMLPLPLTLAGAIITVKDSSGTSRPAPLFFVSPQQFNFAIPSSTSTGLATVTISGNSQTVSINQQIAAVAPGLFLASGFAAGNVITDTGGVRHNAITIFADANGAIQAMPVVLHPGTAQVALQLYVTRIRSHATPVIATIGTVIITASYAGTSGFTGEDQINLMLPDSLKAAGLVNVTLTVDGQNTNSGQLLFQ